MEKWWIMHCIQPTRRHRIPQSALPPAATAPSQPATTGCCSATSVHYGLHPKGPENGSRLFLTPQRPGKTRRLGKKLPRLGNQTLRLGNQTPRLRKFTHHLTHLIIYRHYIKPTGYTTQVTRICPPKRLSYEQNAAIKFKKNIFLLLF